MAVVRSVKNERFLHEISSPSLVKQAQERLNAVVRLMVREGSLDRRVLIPEYISYSDLDRQQDTDVMVKIVDVEPNSPAAIVTGFGTHPPMVWIAAPRVKAVFDRVWSPELNYDVELLGTWEMDIQQVLADNMARDVLAREDGAFFTAADTYLGEVDTLNNYTGHYPYVTIYGGITRETLQEAIAVMYKSYYRLAPAKAVLNFVTARRLLALGSEELGYEMATQTFKEGFGAWKMDNIEWIVTIKSHIVPDDKIYFFADPRAVGKLYILTDVMTHMKVEGFQMNLRCVETIAQVVANAAAVSAVNFA